MRDKAAAREERRRVAIFAEWLATGRFTYPRLRSFREACDRGAVLGLGKEDFERKQEQETAHESR